MKKPIIKIVAVADIHIGALDPEYQYKQLRENLIQYCIDNDVDILVICGDTMDRQVNVDSLESAVLSRFMDDLEALDCKVLMIEGTKSHDNRQMLAYSHKVNDRFKMYSKVTKDCIDDMDILFIPEEYMADPDDYYKDYINSNVKYDLVFGHGMFDFVGFVHKIKNNVKKLTSPTWNYEAHFKDIVHGPVTFGHYHIHDDNIYVGSFGRYHHGEEEPKGFIEIEYDKVNKRTVSRTHIETKDSLIFKTVLASELNNDNDLLLKELDNLKDNSFRLKIKVDEVLDSLKESVIKGFVRDNSLVTTMDYSQLNKRKKETILNSIEKSSELLDNMKKYRDMTLIQATMEFAKENLNTSLTENDIRSALEN